MITSSSNAQVKQILQLNTKARLRRELGLFTAEGVKLFREAPPELREKVYVASSFENENKALLEGISYEIVDDRVFGRMCDTQTPQGILTVLRMPSYEREDLLRTDHPLLLVLEDLQDPGNVGTILRTAEGAGVTGVILSRKCVDLFHPKTIRSTMGSIFRVPFIYEDQPEDAVNWLKASGIRTFAAHLRGNHFYSEEDYTGGSAFLIGNEAKGLSEELAESCDCLIRIPMEGQVESLNAAVAAAVLMYMAHMQRHS
ncbi:TrmH family RNA methyltransferase [Lachnospiraceae bacterium LCP19S3_B12]